jgi:hypothetical protein
VRPAPEHVGREHRQEDHLRHGGEADPGEEQRQRPDRRNPAAYRTPSTKCRPTDAAVCARSSRGSRIASSAATAADS